MKNILIIIIFTIVGFTSQGQYSIGFKEVHSINKSVTTLNKKKIPIQVFGGVTTNFNFYTLFEIGAVVGAAYGGKYGINAIYRRAYMGQNVYGVGLTWIINPQDWVHGGLTVNALGYTKQHMGRPEFMTIEATLDMYWTINDCIKIKAGIGFIGGLPHIQGNILFGNFNPVYWRGHWNNKRVERLKNKQYEYHRVQSRNQ